MVDAAWRDQIPAHKGQLPNGEPVWRTDVGGNPTAAVTILAVYPAARVRQQVVGGRRLNLPVAVERTSFETGVSRSGQELQRRYLAPLGLTHADVRLVDLWPYFMANKRGTPGATMADNLAWYEQATGTRLDIDARPDPAELVRLAGVLPGNTARLAEFLRDTELVITLGLEAAAFLRGLPYSVVAASAGSLLYQPPVGASMGSVRFEAVHAVHPGLLMARSAGTGDWGRRHEQWLREGGRQAVARLRAS
jgi:hypothetical protein